MKRYVAALVVVVMIALSGCGSSDVKENSSPSTAPTAAVQVDESQVVEYLGLKNYRFKTDDGTTCEVSVVMTNANMVNMYAEAGDNVATNKDGTVGVKISSSEAVTCQVALAERLYNFPN